ncbi:hypothetical protein ANANG_G00104320 [Anguilla anguilla]|uniref:SAM domain-containing protein n=1 Tax=Anguilla anguilla TaxID=7936 RepID=A0A9D3MH73_ANGAN|nr:hypothetical protein ANANG_G00104320 [Anguilla anguilla]
MQSPHTAELRFTLEPISNGSGGHAPALSHSAKRHGHLRRAAGPPPDGPPAGQHAPAAPGPQPHVVPTGRGPWPGLLPAGLGPGLLPTLTDVFGLPTPPLGGERFGLGSGRSRSPSPLTLIQAVSNKPFASKPVLLWTKHDVADWLESLNLAEHKDAFLDNEIEGAHLPNLQKEDLIDLGVTRVGHRMNIERALKVLMDR